VPKGSWKLQRGAQDAGDAVSISIAYVTGLDVLKQRHPLVRVQVDAQKVFEKFEPLPHRGDLRSPERFQRLRGGV
jgi:hypothetical protein